VGRPGICPGRKDVTGIIGNMLLVNSGFYTRKNCSANYPQFGYARSKRFAGCVQDRKISKNVGLKRCPDMSGRAWAQRHITEDPHLQQDGTSVRTPGLTGADLATSVCKRETPRVFLYVPLYSVLLHRLVSANQCLTKVILLRRVCVVIVMSYGLMTLCCGVMRCTSGHVTQTSPTDGIGSLVDVWNLEFVV
jgi:hypothetical protein